MHKTTHIFDRTIGLITVITLVVAPIIFLPITADYYETNKLMLVAISAAIVLIIWSLRMALSGKIPSLFIKTIGLFFILLASLVSLIISTSNKADGAFQLYGPVSLTGLIILLLFGVPHIRGFIKNLFPWFISGMGAVLGIISIYQFFGLGKSMFPGFTPLADPYWTPTGSIITHLAILFIILPIILRLTYKSYKSNKDIEVSVAIIILIVILGGIGFSTYRIFTAWQTVYIPFWTGWITMLDALKNPKSALFGVGLDNYLGASSLSRPASLNLTQFWNIRFFSGSSGLLHIGTVMGTMGIGAFIVYLLMFLKIRSNHDRLLNISFIMTMLALILTPPTSSILIFSACILAYSSSIKHSDSVDQFSLPDNLRQTLGSIPVIVVILILISGYGLMRYYRGEIYFKNALDKAASNDGTGTYNIIQNALLSNSYQTKYHVFMSQVSAAMANNLAQNPPAATESGKPATLREEDRNMISQLLQVSIQEARRATELAPLSPVAWETLARNYQSISGIVDGADGWAITAYQRSIQVEPTNPLLRMSLGSIFLAAKDFDSARDLFQAAAQLKPDYANAFYNLAFVYRQTGNLTREQQSLEQTLVLVPKDSEDAKKVQNELDAVKAKIDQQKQTEEARNTPNTAISPATNQPPLDINEKPEPVITPKLELPELATPSAQ